MKQKYEKPSMVIEKFKMCQNIAYGCKYTGDGDFDYKANARNEYDCGWYIPEWDMYMWSNEKCTMEQVDESIIGCYNGPESGIVAFAS